MVWIDRGCTTGRRKGVCVAAGAPLLSGTFIHSHRRLVIVCGSNDVADVGTQTTLGWGAVCRGWALTSEAFPIPDGRAAKRKEEEEEEEGKTTFQEQTMDQAQSIDD